MTSSCDVTLALLVCPVITQLEWLFEVHHHGFYLFVSFPTWTSFDKRYSSKSVLVFVLHLMTLFIRRSIISNRETKRRIIVSKTRPKLVVQHRFILSFVQTGYVAWVSQLSLSLHPPLAVPLLSPPLAGQALFSLFPDFFQREICEVFIFEMNPEPRAWLTLFIEHLHSSSPRPRYPNQTLPNSPR